MDHEISLESAIARPPSHAIARPFLSFVRPASGNDAQFHPFPSNSKICSNYFKTMPIHRSNHIESTWIYWPIYPQNSSNYLKISQKYMVYLNIFESFWACGSNGLDCGRKNSLGKQQLWQALLYLASNWIVVFFVWMCLNVYNMFIHFPWRCWEMLEDYLIRYSMIYYNILRHHRWIFIEFSYISSAKREGKCPIIIQHSVRGRVLPKKSLGSIIL